ncbi:FbpB family small basic protein [Bacillus cereus group sp. Bc222]|nr:MULTISPECIES: FbpB family small basic protein [unclassified Bacillus cereus group]MDA2236935.1 FbpB family small basic protein [Bacillus cereus group sp. Bc222]MDA2584558.1 FbpB family small basic protein [Bacillus cereus group sp. Bc062]
MRKKVRKSFKQLLIENKQSLLNNKENMKEIEERIEKRHVAYSGAVIK